MKKLTFLYLLFAVACLMPSQTSFGQGPVIISGLDTEYGFRPSNTSHGSIVMWAGVIQTGIINNVNNNPTGPILVIGGGKTTTDEMTQFWNQVSGALGKSVTYSNSITGDISTIPFSGYSMIAICNTADGSGKLTAAELATISARQADVAAFVNAGGGLFASACNIAPMYGYIDIGSPPLVSNAAGCGGSLPTPDGAAMGIVPIAGPFHNNFSSWPSFLGVLSTCRDSNVILGGASVTIPSSDDGAYCCDTDNLVTNGNFESGLLGISTSYTGTPFWPGSYDVRADGGPFNATITDHSFCVDPSLYPTNDMFMVVNGKTQQTTSSVIWQQTISGLEEGKEYRFCANFKDMEQCTFNIFPTITMNVSGTTVTQTINTNDSNPCDWQNVGLTFLATGPTHTMQIWLDETGNGDGNDLAIDDIGVFEVVDGDDVFITVQHQGNTNTITASVNTISPVDDAPYDANVCEDYWFTYKTPSFPGGGFIDFAYGDENGHYGTYPGTQPWNTTTTFPGYPFVSNSLYVVGLYVRASECCEEVFEYQVTFNGIQQNGGLTPAQEAQIKDWIINGYAGPGTTYEDGDLQPRNETVRLYPNPVNDQLTISLLDATILQIEIATLSGKKLSSKMVQRSSKEATVDVGAFPSGMYLVTIVDAQQEVHTAKMIKK